MRVCVCVCVCVCFCVSRSDSVGLPLPLSLQAQEVTALRRAFKRLDASYAPRVTFIIVQKRHHTRFFAMSRQDSDRSGNPLREYSPLPLSPLCPSVPLSLCLSVSLSLSRIARMPIVLASWHCGRFGRLPPDRV